MKFVHFLQRLRCRRGPKPIGPSDNTLGLTFLVQPNFYYFEGCGRPCWLPLNPAPKRGGPDWAVTDGWPTEPDYADYKYIKRNYVLDDPDMVDNYVRVIGQVRSQMTVNEIGQKSDIWDVIAIPPEKATRNTHLIAETDADGNYIVYASDLWLGNTGWRDIPYEMPQATLDLLDT